MYVCPRSWKLDYILCNITFFTKCIYNNIGIMFSVLWKHAKNITSNFILVPQKEACRKNFFMVVSILTALIKKKWMMLFSVSLLFMFILTCWCGNSIRLVGCNFHKKVLRRDFFVSDAFSTFLLPQMTNGSTILTIQLFKVCFICQSFMRKHESQEISSVYFIYRHIVYITMARPNL